MKRIYLAVLFATACGDNSQACGPGTSNVDGVCAPDNSGEICGDGTLLDPTSGACAPDPGLCGSGTVLINGTCQDPTAGLTIDLEEGPEPNGFETGATSAGNITLKAIGTGFVVHGCIEPNADLADFDDYRITVDGPTLIDVTADGVHGLAAGFVTLGDDPALATWLRFGVNTMTDMSHRELFFPKAGTYEFAMADTRSLLGIIAGAAVIPLAGNDDGTSCYYVTLTREAIPAPMHLAVPVGTNDMISNKVLFYSGTLTSGVNDLQESISSPYAAPGFAVLISDELRAVDDRGEIAFAGVKDTDTDLIAVDAVYNYAYTPPTFSLSFAAATVAMPLPTANTSVTDTTKTQVGSRFGTTNQFYFDAPQDGATLGMNLASTKPLQGVVWDSDLHVVSQFGGFAPAQPFTSYVGLWRAPKAGRYYFALIDPVDTANTSFTITSTVTQLAPAGIAIEMPLTAQAPNAFGSNPYTLDLAGQEWDLFAATNTAISTFDPTTAFGRLDALGALPPDARPVFSFDGTAQGYVVQGLSALYVKANPHGTFDLNFSTRVKTDVSATTYPGETSPAGDVHRYFLPVVSGSSVTITVHPNGAQDPILERLNADETVAATSNNAAGVDEVLSFIAPVSDYVAFSVRGSGGAPQTYDLSIAITPAFYSFHPSTTAFHDVCLGGTHIPVGDTSDVFGTPAGFNFYGGFDSLYVIAANGYISFDPNDNGLATPAPLPDGAGAANIAPSWQPLAHATVCAKVTGTKTAIQWSSDTAQVQAILDTSDSSIEFVYGPDTVSAGAGAIGGVQDLTGTHATETGDGNIAPFGAPGTSVRLTHP